MAAENQIVHENRPAALGSIMGDAGEPSVYTNELYYVRIIRVHVILYSHASAGIDSYTISPEVG